MIPWEANNSSSRLCGLRNVRAMQHWPECDIWGSRPRPHDARTQHWECPHSIPESAHIQSFYCFFTFLCDNIRATKLIPWECPHSTGLLCFTRFETMLGNKAGFLGVSRCNVSIVFTYFETIIRVNKVDSLGGHQLQLTAIRSAQCPRNATLARA